MTLLPKTESLRHEFCDLTTLHFWSRFYKDSGGRNVNRSAGSLSCNTHEFCKIMTLQSCSRFCKDSGDRSVSKSAGSLSYKIQCRAHKKMQSKIENILNLQNPTTFFWYFSGRLVDLSIIHFNHDSLQSIHKSTFWTILCFCFKHCSL